MIRNAAVAGFVLSMALQFPAVAQSASPMRTRDITRMSQFDVARFLQRSDLVFVPVGSVEGNGASPSDKDYATALGMAMRMAEAADGLYAPNLSYFYAGSTITSEATVNVSLEESRRYLKSVARSLLRQGFRTQIWVTMGHGPAPLFVGSMVREFFDETHVPILRIDAGETARRLRVPGDKLSYGLYSILNRLEDLPLAGDVPQMDVSSTDANPGLATLSKLGYSGSLTVGFWHSDPNAHGYSTANLPKSTAERAEWAKQGREQVEALVRAMNVPAAVEALRQHRKFTEDEIVSKRGRMLR